MSSVRSLCWCYFLSILAIQSFPPTVLGQLAITSDNELTPLGDTATYTCTNDTGGFVSVLVQLPDMENSLNTLDVDVKPILDARGIEFDDSSLVLTILATEMNNLTTLQCLEVLPPFSSFNSDILTFTAIGPPLAPFVNSSLLNSTAVLLEWDEPFTWPDHDILYYQVAEVPDGGSKRVFNITDLFHTYTSTTPGAETCQVVNFVVTAISDVGVSEPGVAMEGLPIVPGMFVEINAKVTFQKNGDPEVDITVQAPAVCDYQLAELRVSVSAVFDANQSLPTATYFYSGQPELVIVEHDTSTGLVTNTSYSGWAEVETSAGNSTADFTFDTMNSKAAGHQPLLWGMICALVAAAMVTTTLV